MTAKGNKINSILNIINLFILQALHGCRQFVS